jgi:hypothetical protein
MNAITNLYDYNNYEFDTKPSIKLHFQPKRVFNLTIDEHECELEEIVTAVPYSYKVSKLKVSKDIGFSYKAKQAKWAAEEVEREAAAKAEEDKKNATTILYNYNGWEAVKVDAKGRTLSIMFAPGEWSEEVKYYN